MSIHALCRFPFLRLLLVAGAAFMWVRSHTHSDLAGIFLRRGTLQVVGSDRGRVIFAMTNIEFGASRAYTWDKLSVTNAEFDNVRQLLYETTPLPENRMGMFFGSSPTDPFAIPGANYRYIVMPFWYPVALLSVALLLGLRKFWKRRHWGSPGVCRACGYDVRFSGERCPECGEAIRTKGRAATAVTA